ncbi:hypothetical protein LX36DRAFT_275926 [Colletotrichum falcatum]|nr:hypothetical protein LX36DRAFT_275926 [Colletotrichum falcatum]
MQPDQGGSGPEQWVQRNEPVERAGPRGCSRYTRRDWIDDEERRVKRRRGERKKKEKKANQYYKLRGGGEKEGGGPQKLTSLRLQIEGSCGSTQLKIASRALQTTRESGMMGFGRTTGSSENQTTADYLPMPATLSLPPHWPTARKGTPGSRRFNASPNSVCSRTWQTTFSFDFNGAPASGFF